MSNGVRPGSAAQWPLVGWRAVIAQYAGTLVAGTAALVVGALLVWSARQQGLPADPVRAFALVPGLTLGGLGIDRWQTRAPVLGLAYLRRATFYWAAVFPLARLLQDLLAFVSYRLTDPTLELASVSPAWAGPGALVGWLLVQAVFGAGFGFGFGMLARRLSNALTRRRAPPVC